MTYGRLISRDPFSRTETWRETVYAPGQSCQWCGQRRPGASGNLFRYRVEHDSGRIERIPKLFDTIDCMRAYYGETR